VGLVATSLTARLAYEMITRCPQIAFLVSVVGVIDVRYTLERVFGCDLTIVAPNDLPEFVEFQRQKIRPKLFYRDYHDQGWGKLNEEALALAPQPIANFVAEHDSWIDTAAVRKIFCKQHQGPRRVLELEGSGHHLGVNPAVARVLMIRVTEVVRELAGAPPDLSGHEPTFAELTEQVLLERRMQRARDPVANVGASPIAQEPTILA
jgi:acyl transferase